MPLGHPKAIWGIVSWIAIIGALVAHGGTAHERRGAIASVAGWAIGVFSP